MANVFRQTPRLKLSDFFSQGGVSQIVAADFFEAAPGPSYAGVLRRWNGTAWIKATLKRWTGAAFTHATLRIWTGSEWGLIDTT